MLHFKKIVFLLTIIVFFQGCTNSEITKEDCIKEKKKYKITKVLNLRTGKYQAKVVCLQ